MAIFGISFFAVIIGLILIVLLKKTSPPLPQEQVHFENPDNKPRFLLDADAFEEVCLEFLKRFNLEKKHLIWANEHELEIAMVDETPVVGGIYLILAIFNPPDQLVQMHKVTGFLDTVKGEEAAKGIVITTGYFADDAIRSIEDHPVELVNLVAFIDYLKKFGMYDSQFDSPDKDE